MLLYKLKQIYWQAFYKKIIFNISKSRITLHKCTSSHSNVLKFKTHKQACCYPSFKEKNVTNFTTAEKLRKMIVQNENVPSSKDSVPNKY